jgi:rhamnogalacturonyl hydrolase YesR
MKTGERKMKKTLSIVIIGILFISMFSIFAPKALGTASETSLQVAEKAATWTISQAISENGGYKWANYLQGGPRYVSTVPFGGSGFGTFYLKLYKQTGNTLYLDYAKGAAHWVISQAVSDSGGYKWPHPDDDIPSPGWWLSPMVSGIGDFLLSMYQTTGDSTYMEYAAGAARWLMVMAYWGEAGCFIPYNPPGPYGTQASHGIGPGREAYTVTFLLRMYQETKDTSYLPYVRGTAEWLISGPDRVVDANGYKWSFNRPYGSVYPPDGNGQIALFFYEIYEALGDPTYLQYAQGTMNWLLSQAVINGNTAKWYDPATGLYMTLPLSGMGGFQGFWGIPEPNCLLMAVYDITMNTTYLDYAKKLANWMTSSDIAVSEGGGYKFPNFQGSSFYSAYQNAKIYNFLSWLSSLTGETTYFNYADGALQWIIFSATESNGGYSWRTIPYFPYNAAWFESGAAGIGYYLVRVVKADMHHDVAVVNVSTSKIGCLPMPTVGKGYPVSIYVITSNLGGFTETVNVTIYAINNTSATIIGTQNRTILSLQSAMLRFAWNTANSSYGDYTIKAVATQVSNETDITNNEATDVDIRVVIPGDANGDTKVDLKDLYALAKSFGSTPGQLLRPWNPNCDINNDLKIDLKDYYIASRSFGKAQAS